MGWLKGGKLAFDQAGRHEVARSGEHTLFGFGRGQFEEHEAQVRHGMAQGIAIAALERRAGEDWSFAGFERGLQLFSQAD
ncbi:hypothetical protein D3C76_1564980 [compost metagenome]